MIKMRKFVIFAELLNLVYREGTGDEIFLAFEFGAKVILYSKIKISNLG